MSTYFDYRYHFPLTGVALAADAFTAWCAGGLLAADAPPDNMLGEPILLNGTQIACGRAGRPAVAFTDADTGAAITIPAAGDADFIYIHLRSELALPAGFAPAAYGLVATDPAESAAVLGVWA